MSDCYYDNQLCEGELWECQTCEQHYCQAHFHQTDKGENVECVACERERLEAEKKEDEKPRGWVFVDDETKEEVGFAEPTEYRNADDAVDRFGRSYGDDFGVYFRDSNGVLCSCACEDAPDDFD